MNTRETKQREVSDEEKSGLLEKISQYENLRKQQFWGGLFGYSKCQKINAAEALRDVINNPDKINAIVPHLGALNDGRLKTCWNSYIKLYPEQYKTIQDNLKDADEVKPQHKLN